MQRVDTSLALEQLRCQMREAATTGRRDRELAWIGLAISNHVAEGFQTKRRSGNEHLRHECNEADWGEVLLGIVRKIRRDLRRYRHWPHESEQECVAVRRRFNDAVGANRAAGTDFVLNDNSLFQCFGQRFCKST